MEMIDEADLDLAAVSAVLDQAFFETERSGERALYVREGLEFPCWLELNEGQKLLELWTYAEPQLSSDEDLDAQCASLNSKIVLPTFWTSGERVYARYFMTYSGAIAKAHMVGMLRRFSSAFRFALNSLETGSVRDRLRPPDRLHS